MVELYLIFLLLAAAVLDLAGLLCPMATRVDDPSRAGTVTARRVRLRRAA